MKGLLFLRLWAFVANYVGAGAWRVSLSHLSQQGVRPRHSHALVKRSLLSHMSEDSAAYRESHWKATMLKGALTLGASKPKSVIALFPGVGGSAKNVVGLGNGWYEQNPDTQVILFDTDAFAADRAFSAVWNLLPTLLSSDSDLSNPAVDGYDVNNKIFDAAKSRSNFFGDVLLSCCNDVSHALQEVLSEYGLTDENLVLAGFSQGASIAAYTGFMRGAAGIILMGGPGAPQLQLLPPPAKTGTQVCIISGDSDGLAPHEQLVAAFRSYGGHVNILPGVSHQILQDHVDTGGAFISKLFTESELRSKVVLTNSKPVTESELELR